MGKSTDLKGLKLFNRGKVRDIYNLGRELLIVTTDRISAFDVVLPTPIPLKGETLTQMSLFWFGKTNHIVKDHLSDTPLSSVLTDKSEYEILKNQSMIVNKAKPLPVEAIVRGYLSGSGWTEYYKQGTVCGIKLPKGLVESSKLPEPIFTPSTKAEIGKHDENISIEKAADILGREVALKVQELALRIYFEMSEYALSRGIIIADSKFEFGMLDGEIILIDEVLTPDSSRFWPLASYKPGKSQPSFDKQYVRDWLISSGWDKKSPAPELPPDVVLKTTEKYREALKRLI